MTGLEFNTADKVYFPQLNNLANGNKNAVLTACNVTESSPKAMTADVVSGNVFFSDTTVAVSSGTVNFSSAPTTNSRIDLVLVDNTGVLSISTGTATVSPSPALYDVDTQIPLAQVTIAANVTTISDSDIFDIRVLNVGGTGTGTGSSGSFGKHVEEFTAQTSISVTHNLGDDDVIAQVYDSNNDLIEPDNVEILDINSLTVTFAVAETGKIVIFGGNGVNNGYYSEGFTSQTSVSVNHLLNNTNCLIQVVDSSSKTIIPTEIERIDEDNATITFGSSQSGTIIVAGGISSTGIPSGMSQGDIIYHNGTELTKLVAGTAGQVLQTNGSSANPEWSGGGSGNNSEIVAKVLKASGSYINGDNTAAEEFNIAGGRNSTVNTGASDAVFNTNLYECQGGSGSYSDSILVCDSNLVDVNSETKSFSLHWEGDFPADTSGSFDIQTISTGLSYDVDTNNPDRNTGSDSATFLKTDGTKLYECTGNAGAGLRFIFQSTLTTAWNISTAIYDAKKFDTENEDTSMQGLYIKSDGTKFYVCGTTNDKVYQYTMSTPWDISTGSYDSKSADISAEVGFSTGLYFKDDGTKMYVTDQTAKKVFQYGLSTAWDVSTASYDTKSADISAEDATIDGLFFEDDGSTMYVNGTANDKVFQYTVSTPWDISTASYASKSFDTSSELSYGASLFIKPDGTKFYIADFSSVYVFQYAMTTPWDISTGVFELTNILNLPVNTTTKKTGTVLKGPLLTTTDVTITANLVTTNVNNTPTISLWGLDKN